MLLVSIYVYSSCIFITSRWVCNVPELLSVTEVCRQAGLCLPQTALQKPLPQARVHIWLRLWLEHSKN